MAGPAQDYRDLLPAVQYGQPGAAGWALPPRAARSANGAIGAGAFPAGAPAPGGGRNVASRAIAADGAAGRNASQAGPLLAVATVAVAASISVLLPLAGLVGALIALLLLRAASLTGGSMTNRRSARGIRPTDPVLAAVVFPAAMLRSLIMFALLAPVAAVFGGLVAAVTILVNPVHPVAQAGAYAAGAIVVFYGLGPGSARTRRPLARFFNALGRTPASGIVVFVGMAALAIGTIVAAATHPPFYWPSGNLAARLPHLPKLPGVLRGLRLAVFRLIGRQA